MKSKCFNRLKRKQVCVKQSTSNTDCKGGPGPVSSEAIKTRLMLNVLSGIPLSEAVHPSFTIGLLL
jgi:hypothetical protein